MSSGISFGHPLRIYNHILLLGLGRVEFHASLVHKLQEVRPARNNAYRRRAAVMTGMPFTVLIWQLEVDGQLPM